MNKTLGFVFVLIVGPILACVLFPGPSHTLWKQEYELSFGKE